MKDHRTLTPRQEARAQRALFEAILTLRSVDECRAFFRDLCTPAERQALTDRWAVVGLLQDGVPYREIHKQTGVSVTTIGRVARALSSGNGGYQLVTERLSTQPAGAGRPGSAAGTRTEDRSTRQTRRDGSGSDRSTGRPPAAPSTRGRTRTRRSDKTSAGRPAAGHAPPTHRA